MRRNLAAFVMLAFVICSVPASVAAQGYTFTTIDVPGAAFTEALGINDQRQIVGGYDSDPNTGFTRHGFLTDDRVTFSTIDYPASPGTVARGIDPGGRIVGAFCCVPNEGGFLYDGTTFTPITVPGWPAFANNASGVNPGGHIVGAASDATGVHGYITTDGVTFTEFDYPGSRDTEAQGIDDGGQIVGYFIDGSGTLHGFLKDAAAFTQIDVPGSASTLAFGINTGRIVGRFTATAGGPVHAFVMDGTTFTQLDVPGALSTEAFGINAAGDLVGRYQDAAGLTHGFLASAGCSAPPSVQCVPVAKPKGRNGDGGDDEDDDGGFFRVSAQGTCAPSVTIKIGGFALTDGETIRIKSTHKPGVRMEPGKKIPTFKVGPGGNVITATDAAGNTASATCVTPSKEEEKKGTEKGSEKKK